MKRLLVLCMVPASIAACTSKSGDGGPAPAFTSADLVGDWASVECEASPGPSGTTYLQREAVFTTTNVDVTLHAYGDPACAHPLFSGHIGATYTLAGAIAGLPGTRGGDVTFASLRMTALDPSFVKVFDDSHCGSGNWVVNQEQDIAPTGCLFLHPIATCSQDFDLFKLVGRQLTLGQRTENMCTVDRRATALSPYSLAKK